MGARMLKERPSLSISKLPAELPVELWIQDDSYFPAYGGGSKARKIGPFLEEAEKLGCNAVVTAGAANSNHAKVVALACAQKRWNCTVVVHDTEDYSKGNLLLMKMAGAKLVFTSLSQVGSVMDQEMEAFRQSGLKPYYIYGGGHALPGYKAYYWAALQLVEEYSELKPDFIVHASGTGGTQAGLIVGFDQALPESTVIGVSVARNQARGVTAVSNACRELTDHLGIMPVSESKVIFKDDWIGEGYGHSYSALLETIKNFSQNHGLITDPTYTGKALHGLVSMIRSGEIEPGSKVLFWHTGGLINLFEHTQKLIK